MGLFDIAYKKSVRGMELTYAEKFAVFVMHFAEEPWRGKIFPYAAGRDWNVRDDYPIRDGCSSYTPKEADTVVGVKTVCKGYRPNVNISGDLSNHAFCRECDKFTPPQERGADNDISNLPVSRL